MAGAAIIATAKGTNDNKDKTSVNVISSASLDTARYFTASESYNLILNDTVLRDEIAAGIYYKDIGSRDNQTIAESNISYSNASASVKTVYRNKAITDIRNLVTEGYIRIDRTLQDVNIVTEKANL